VSIAVVIPARDAAATLPACLEALEAEVILVDNGSRDDTAAVAEARGVRVLRRARGEGPGAARNDGVAATDAELIAFTDADCVPAPGWLEAGERALRDADLVQGRVAPAGPVGRGEHSVWVDRETGLYETANLFVRREWFDRVGGFGPGIAAAGRPFGEDVLFGWAARRVGARTAYCAEALVHHAVLPFDPLAERRRLQHFPELIRAVPELRAELFARTFLTKRTAAFDLAVVALLARRPLLALPYIALRPRPVQDAVGAAALVYGSLRAQTPVF
jgi:glycosyltransferase involved in cell wall biosynthesis